MRKILQISELIKLFIQLCFVLIIFNTNIIQLVAQSYYYNVSYGITEDYDMSAPTGKTIMTSPLNDSFSLTQTLPFTWKFYGKDVTSFKVSDNGYITFDLTAGKSEPNNTALPNSASPNNAIYAFWDNLELSNNPSFMTNTVKTYTVGSAPERIFVIQWQVTPLGKLANGNYLYFALRIYEKGDFDILLQQIRLESGTMSGTVGCENEDGTDGTMTDKSPNMTYTGGVFLYEKCPVYSFTYGKKLGNNCSLSQIEIPKLLSSNKYYNFEATIINHGVNVVNSIDISYQSDDNLPRTTNFIGINIKPNDSFVFTLPIEYKPKNVGDFEYIKIWINKVNNEPDEDNSNDTLTHIAFVNNGNSVTKKVLIEEFSTAPCGFCPEGHLFLEAILDTIPNVIGFTHHSGYLTDAMTIKESEDIANEMANGAPTACIDRVQWPETIKIAIGRNEWAAKTIESLSTQAVVDINISARRIENNERKFEIKTDLDFVDYPYPGDMRLNVFIVEDHVTGTGKGYDQTNYYNETKGHYFYGKGDPIVGYDHRRVLRASLTGSWGEGGVIPAYVNPESKYSKTFIYEAPENIKTKDLSIIAFVSYFESKVRQILNAEQYNEIFLGIDDLIKGENNISIYPNPANDFSKIYYVISKSGNYQLAMYDIFGYEMKRIFSGFRENGNYIINLELSSFNNGFYFIKMMSDAGDIKTEKLILIR